MAVVQLIHFLSIGINLKYLNANSIYIASDDIRSETFSISISFGKRSFTYYVSQFVVILDPLPLSTTVIIGTPPYNYVSFSNFLIFCLFLQQKIVYVSKALPPPPSLSAFVSFWKPSLL